MSTSQSPEDLARLKAVVTSHAGDWLHAPPLTAVGLRLSDEAIRVAIGYRLGTNICQPHTCACGSTVDARVLHGLACRKSGPCHIRHSQLSDLIWQAVKKAQIPASKEPIGLSRANGKRPDGATLVSWTRGKPLAWNVTVPDTYAASHLQLISTTACAAAEKAAVNKSTKYVAIAATHSFVPVAIETVPGANSQRNSSKILEDGSRRLPTSRSRRHICTRGGR